MAGLLEKVERRLGEKLFIKGDRCLGPKCAVARRAYPPGAHGKKRTRKRETSGFGALLAEKQKMRFLYGLDDKDIERYSKEASLRKGIYSSILLRMLEERLDNVVFRLGFAYSRRSARQLIVHCHVTVNGITARAPSRALRKGDAVSLKERFLKSPAFAHIADYLKKCEAPQWLSLDKAKKAGIMREHPEGGDIGILIDAAKIKEFYSR